MRIVNARLKLQILTPSNRTREHATWHLAIHNSFPQRAPWSGVATCFSSTPPPFQPALHPFLQIPGDARPLLAASILSCRDHFKDIVRVAIVPTGLRGILWRWRRACRVETRHTRSASAHVSRCGPLRAPARGGASSSDVSMTTPFNSFETVRFICVFIRFPHAIWLTSPTVTVLLDSFCVSVF